MKTKIIMAAVAMTLSVSANAEVLRKRRSSAIHHGSLKRYLRPHRQETVLL